MEFKSKHEFLRYEIRKLIEDNNLNPGDKLPTELEFQKEYDVSRHTVRSALSYLENEGVIYKEQGLGSFVAKQNGVNKTKEIGVITTYISDYIFPYIIRGIEKELTENGYTMILTSTDNDVNLETRAVNMMLDRNVDGVIVEPTKSAYYNQNIGLYLKLKEQGVPLVMINAKYEELDLPVVMMDDFKSGYMATQELIENNHNNIGGIFKIDDRQGKERLKGYMQACYDYGVEYNSNNVIVYETETLKDVMTGPVHEMVKDKRVTGIVCYNDKIVIDLLDIIWSYGFNVPNDFSIVSHDNSDLSEMTKVHFTSVEHPKIELGSLAARKVIESIEAGNAEIESTIYESELNKKSSVRTLDLEDSK